MTSRGTTRFASTSATIDPRRIDTQQNYHQNVHFCLQKIEILIFMQIFPRNTD